MTTKTYTPLSNRGPAVVAGLVLLAGYVVGPAIAHIIVRFANSDRLAPIGD